MQNGNDQIRLRKLEEKDAVGMLEWMQDSEVQKEFQFHADEKDIKSVIDFIQHAEIQVIDGQDLHYAIADENDEYQGTISLKSVDLTDRKAWGRGIASKATREILRLAFEQFGLERIYLNVLADNKRAIRMYERIGFVYEGAFRKHLFLRGEYKTLKWYSILREEYLAKYVGSCETLD